MAKRKGSRKTGKSKGGRRMGAISKSDLTNVGIGIGAAVIAKVLAKNVPEKYKKYSTVGLTVAGVAMTMAKNPMLKAAGMGIAISAGQQLVGQFVPALAGGSMIRFDSQGRRMSGYNNVPGIGQAGFPKPNAIGQGFPKPSALGNVASMYAAGAMGE